MNAVALWTAPHPSETRTQKNVLVVNEAGVNVCEVAPGTGFEMSPDNPSYHWKDNGGTALA